LLGVALLPGLAAVSMRRGEDLYRGKEPLRGRIRGQNDLLPPEAVRCVNCHNPASKDRLSGRPAPRIDGEWLMESRQRHGGPPSSYNQTSFCKVLRAGTDPVYVLVAREMPVYEMDERQCASLWIFLTTTNPPAKGAADERHPPTP
jgi:hypothetical protein